MPVQQIAGDRIHPRLLSNDRGLKQLRMRDRRGPVILPAAEELDRLLTLRHG
jgi:hypothetical protein